MRNNKVVEHKTVHELNNMSMLYIHVGCHVTFVTVIQPRDDVIGCGTIFTNLTIEHDPDSVSRRRPVMPPPLTLKPPDKERLFKRKDEGYVSGSRSSRQLRRGRTNNQERSSSTSRLLEGY
ncbi:LIM domain kinase 1 [Homalodisca vitripennis]|nr:LIM domain kinase 1 [Homalodisca vitripennis]